MNINQARAFVRNAGVRAGVPFSQQEVEEYAKAIVNRKLDSQRVQAIAGGRADIRRKNRQQVETLARSLGLPREFTSMFVDSYLETGDIDLALTQVRSSKEYDRLFPNNRRPDGTLRYTEAEYAAVKDAYARTLEDVGLNPSLFDSKFADLIGGDVSVEEFRGRVEALEERIVRAPEEVRQAFASEFGLGADMSVEAILGVALDPEIGEQVRDRRISIAQVTGAAARSGIARSRERVTALLDMGLTADQAFEFFGQASGAVSRLRGVDPGFSVDTFEDAFIGQRSDAISAVRRVDAQARSQFSRSGSVTGDRTGALTGLDRR